MSRTTFGYYDLLEALPKPGCAVCKLLLRDTHKFIDSILHEYVMDADMQGSFRSSRGLCEHHGWQLIRSGNALGVATLYQGALDEVLRLLQGAASGGNVPPGLMRRFFPQNDAGDALADALEGGEPCIACKMQHINEARYIKEIGEHLHDPKMQAAYHASEGLCLEHFKLALRASPDAERTQLLVALQTEIWARLRDDLAEFMRKSDFQNAAEPMGAEGNSWQRVVSRLGGEHGVFGMKHSKG